MSELAYNGQARIQVPGRRPLAARLDDREGEDLVLSVSDLVDGHYVRPDPQTPVSVLWTDDAALWRLDARLLEIRREPRRVWVVRPTAAPARDQRRQAFRLQTSLAVIIRRDGTELRTTTRDISAGGMAVVAKGAHRLSVGEDVTLCFSLDDEIVECGATVVRLSEEGDARIAGMQFIDLSRRHGEMIQRHLVDLQLRLRRRFASV